MKAGKISYAGVGVAVGGVIGFLGVIVGWFKFSYPLNGGTATVTLSGTHDWTGTVAMAAAFGAFAFGGRLRPDAGRAAPPDHRRARRASVRRSC